MTLARAIGPLSGLPGSSRVRGAVKSPASQPKEAWAASCGATDTAHSTRGAACRPVCRARALSAGRPPPELSARSAP
eukprot:scaffold3938_cov30-Phaeocystis_antarctica.AAC.2